MEEDRPAQEIDLSLASLDVIEALLEDPSDPSVFGDVIEANQGRPEVLRLLLHHPHAPEEMRTRVSDILGSLRREATKEEEPPRERKPQGLVQRIQKLSVSERIQLALKGGREVRGILVKDINKEVMLSVLENQKITDTEVEMIARSRSVPEEALRRIPKNREWLKNYMIVTALVTNAKTPAGIAMNLVQLLKTKDLVTLEKNKNVSEAVRSTSKRLLQARKTR